MLSRAEHERSLLQEKLVGLQRDLANAISDHGRQKRDLQAHIDQQLHAIESLQGELRTARSHLEQAR